MGLRNRGFCHSDCTACESSDLASAIVLGIETIVAADKQVAAECGFKHICSVVGLVTNRDCGGFRHIVGILNCIHSAVHLHGPYSRFPDVDNLHILGCELLDGLGRNISTLGHVDNVVLGDLLDIDGHFAATGLTGICLDGNLDGDGACFTGSRGNLNPLFRRSCGPFLIDHESSLLFTGLFCRKSNSGSLDLKACFWFLGLILFAGCQEAGHAQYSDGRPENLFHNVCVNKNGYK